MDIQFQEPFRNTARVHDRRHIHSNSEATSQTLTIEAFDEAGAVFSSLDIFGELFVAVPDGTLELFEDTLFALFGAYFLY